MKAVTITGTAVKRSKNETWLSNSGSSFGVCVLPSTIANIAITEHVPTNTTASRTEIAELKLKDSESTKTIFQASIHHFDCCENLKKKEKTMEDYCLPTRLNKTNGSRTTTMMKSSATAREFHQ